VGKKPIICVWDTETLQTKSILKDGHTHGVCCLGFSADEKVPWSMWYHPCWAHSQLLVSVGMDESRMLVVWDWAKGQMLSTAKGHNDLVRRTWEWCVCHHIVQVFDAQFSPYDQTILASCGVKHIKFWTLSGNMLVAKRGVFGQAGL
jgi:WD40 repeat protein